MKKILTIFILIFLLSYFTACNGGNNSTPNESNNSTPSTSYGNNELPDDEWD